MNGISLVIPTCNRPEKLKLCLVHLRQQTRPPDQILVVNDGQGEVASICHAYFSQEVITVLNGAQAGPCAARNLALGYVQQEVVGFLDDDSYPVDTWVESCLDFFHNYPAITAQLGYIQRYETSHAPLQTFIPTLRQKIYTARHQLFILDNFRQKFAEITCNPTLKTIPGLALHLSGGNSAIRMNFLREHGFFNPCFVTYHDREMAWRILSKNCFIGYNPHLIVHHEHEPSLLRWIRRAIFSKPYERLLLEMYPEHIWENSALYLFVREYSRIPLKDNLTLAERLFLHINTGLLSFLTFSGFQAHVNPIQRDSHEKAHHTAG